MLTDFSRIKKFTVIYYNFIYTNLCIHIYVCMFIYIYMHCTTEEGDRVVENFGCVIIVIIKFLDQDIIEFLSCFIYIYI